MLLVLAIVLVLLLVLLVDGTRKYHVAKFARSIQTIRPCYPLLGSATIFLGHSEERRHENLINALRQVDRIGKCWLGPKLVFYLGHPDLLQKVLMDPNCCEKPFFYEFSKLTHGLFSAKYSIWKPNRKALNPTMNAKILNGFVPIFERFSRRMVDKLKCRPEGTPVNILEFTKECALEMVCGTTLGTDLKQGSGKREFLENIEVCMTRIATRTLSVSLYSDSIYQLTKAHSEEERARKTCLNFAERIIEERRQVLAANPPNRASDRNEDDDGYNIRKPKIFIDQVLGENHSETNISTQNLSEQILTIVAGGYDTSANSVAHTCLFLAMFPHVQEKLALEIQTVLPDSDQELTAETLKHLPYLDKCLKESMRLAPVGSTIARVNTVDIELDGCRIPRGNIFVVNFFTLHRRKDMWGPDAEHFDPENFAPERSKGRHPFAYLPFSLGSRNCIGARYAMISNKIMIIHLVRNFRLSTKIRFEDLKYRLDITLGLVFEHLITLEPRR